MLLELLYPDAKAPLPGATGTELGITIVCVVLLAPLPPVLWVGAPVPTGAIGPPTTVLLELLYPYAYPPLPGATGTELGIMSVCVVLSRSVVVLVSAALEEAEALVRVTSVAALLEVEFALQAASPCATVKLLPESG